MGEVDEKGRQVTGSQRNGRMGGWVRAAVGLACICGTVGLAQARYRDGMNLYEYVKSEPVSGRDPSGRDTQSAAAITSKPQWHADARTMLDKLYGETCARRQKPLQDQGQIKAWKKAVQLDLMTNLCTGDCIGGSDQDTQWCIDETDAMAEAYVIMLVKRAYSKQSYGVDVYMDAYAKIVKPPAKDGVPPENVSLIYARMIEALGPNGPWDSRIIHGGWLSNQWAWMTAGAVDSALKAELKKRKEAEEGARRAKQTPRKAGP